MNATLMSPREVAHAFGVNVKTVTRWDKAGRLKSSRTLGGHRRYNREQIMKLIKETNASS